MVYVIYVAGSLRHVTTGGGRSWRRGKLHANPPKESERHVFFSRIKLVLKDVRKPGKLCYVV